MKSLKCLSVRKLSWIVLVAVVGAGLLAGSTVAQEGSRPDGGKEPADRPDEVLSWRHRILSREAYVKLAEEWEAYVEAHPDDARAYVEWGDALRYGGKHDEASKQFRRAYEIDPRNAAAIEAYVSDSFLRDIDNADMAFAYQKLTEAVGIDPSYPNTYYTLWMASLHGGNERQAADCLRKVVELGDMPRPLLEYGYNMLIGLPKDAILFTNGDNDTYPPIAVQTLKGFRQDVQIVNLSLLNAKWYIRYIRDFGVPIGLTDREIDALAFSKEAKISDQMQQQIYDQLAGAGWKRPLFYSVTVYPGNKALRVKLVLEGLQERIVPITEDEEPAEEFDADKTRELLDTAYRLESLTDPFVDWERESSVARGGNNYAALLQKVGFELYERSPQVDGGRYLHQAVRFFTFHGERERAEQIIEGWSKLAPKSSLLPAAKKLVSNPG